VVPFYLFQLSFFDSYITLITALHVKKGVGTRLE